MCSFFQSSVITPSTWNDQINSPEDVTPPRAERYQLYDPGDIVYIEGDIDAIEFLSENNKTLIRIRDKTDACTFATMRNLTNINVDDHVFLKVKIIEYGTSDNSFILSGNDPHYFGEEAELIDIERDYFSFKPILLIGGVLIVSLGIIIILYNLLLTRRFKNNNEENIQNDE
jgi:hypothetical protein